MYKKFERDHMVEFNNNFALVNYKVGHVDEGEKYFDRLCRLQRILCRKRKMKEVKSEKVEVKKNSPPPKPKMPVWQPGHILALFGSRAIRACRMPSCRHTGYPIRYL